MKIYRGPRSTHRLHNTDSTKTRDLRKWEPGTVLTFNATITEGADRRTDFGVEIEPRDILMLHSALVRYQGSQISELKKQNAELSESVDLLETVLGKISSLANSHRTDAPSLDEVLDVVHEIAEHFSLPFMRREKPIRLKRRWVEWRKL